MKEKIKNKLTQLKDLLLLTSFRKWVVFQFNSLLNYWNWNRMIRKAHRWKKRYEREFFVIPISKTKLGVTDGWYPLNKKWLIKLRGKEKRMKYSRLKKLAYYSTIINSIT